jgi:transposase
VGGGVRGERGRHGDPGPPTRPGRQGRLERGGRKKGLLNPEDEALGRSKGGFSTKVHLACYGKGRPLSVVLTPGQRHGSTHLEALLDAVRVPRPEGTPGRPRKRPEHLIADRGYSFEGCRRLLRRRGISHTIPERKDQKERRAGRPGRRPGFD